MNLFLNASNHHLIHYRKRIFVCSMVFMALSSIVREELIKDMVNEGSIIAEVDTSATVRVILVYFSVKVQISVAKKQVVFH